MNKGKRNSQVASVSDIGLENRARAMERKGLQKSWFLKIKRHHRKSWQKNKRRESIREKKQPWGRGRVTAFTYTEGRGGNCKSKNEPLLGMQTEVSIAKKKGMGALFKKDKHSSQSKVLLLWHCGVGWEERKIVKGGVDGDLYRGTWNIMEKAFNPQHGTSLPPHS